MADKTVKNTYIYDEVPYPGLSFHVTHPDHLATLATLLGMGAYKTWGSITSQDLGGFRKAIFGLKNRSNWRIWSSKTLCKPPRSVPPLTCRCARLACARGWRLLPFWWDSESVNRD